MNDIKAGDLVIVVRTRCCVADLGRVGIVKRIERADAPNDEYEVLCDCGRVIAKDDELVAVLDDSFYPLPLLKKLPPLSEPTTHREEIEA